MAQLRFNNTATAQRFATQVRKPDSGGITDLVTEGRSWQGGPKTFDGAAFAMSTTGSHVRLTTAVWAKQPSQPDDPGLRKLAERALRLPM